MIKFYDAEMKELDNIDVEIEFIETDNCEEILDFCERYGYDSNGIDDFDYSLLNENGTVLFMFNYCLEQWEAIEYNEINEEVPIVKEICEKLEDFDKDEIKQILNVISSYFDI